MSLPQRYLKLCQILLTIIHDTKTPNIFRWYLGHKIPRKFKIFLETSPPWRLGRHNVNVLEESRTKLRGQSITDHIKTDYSFHCKLVLSRWKIDEAKVVRNKTERTWHRPIATGNRRGNKRARSIPSTRIESDWNSVFQLVRYSKQTRQKMSAWELSKLGILRTSSVKRLVKKRKGCVDISASSTC